MVFVRARGGVIDHRRRESGRSSAVLNRLVQDTRSAAPLATTVLERWRHFSGAVRSPGCFTLRSSSSSGLQTRRRRGRRRDGGWSDGQPGAPSAVVRLPRPDHPAGGDPGLLLLPPGVARSPAGARSLVPRILGVFGKYPLNAYGPLFTVLAIPALVNPLLPKLLFAAPISLCRLAGRGAAGRLRRASCGHCCSSGSSVRSPGSRLRTSATSTCSWGSSALAAVRARSRRRDVASGACLGLGVLLKYMPIVLLPFLILDRGRPRYRLRTVMVIVPWAWVPACLSGGPTTFRPLLFAAGRTSQHLSIYRFLKGYYSPLRWIDLNEDPDLAAPAFMLMALLGRGWWFRRRMIEPAPPPCWRFWSRSCSTRSVLPSITWCSSCLPRTG